MEHTKGELDVEIDPEVLPRIVNDCGTTICQMVADDPQDIENAKELVRRWNAFEEGGLVDGLLKACEDALKKLEWPIYTDREKLKMKPCREKLESAITKADYTKG